jgi:hypothetical protein
MRFIRPAILVQSAFDFCRRDLEAALSEQASKPLPPIRLYRYCAVEYVVVTEGYLPFMLGNKGLQGYLGQEWMGVLQGQQALATAVLMVEQRVVEVEKNQLKRFQRR